jgi:glycosyltransferase involved in cell wall biosynthesis
LLPLTTLPQVESVLVVRRKAGPSLPGVEYLCPPRWLRPRWLAVLAEAWLAVRAARRHRPALVHGIYLVPHGLTALLAARLSRRPAVVAIIGTDLHGHLERGVAPWRRFLVACLRRAARVTATGPRSADRLAALGIDRHRLAVLPNAIDVDALARPQGEAALPRDLDLLFLGRLAPGKRPLLFLDLVHRLRALCGRPVRAALLGDGPERGRVRARITELGLGADVDLAGHVADVPAWLARCRLMVLPTVAEGLPYAVVEAMAAGVPPVVSAVGDLPALLQSGENGVLVDDFADLERVATTVAALLADEPRRTRMAAAAKRTVTEHCSLATASRVWSSLLNLAGDEAP